MVVVQAPPRYVSRGGLKLEHALDAFDASVEGAVVIDVGASTGGFTDCLLQRGASRVYAVDVGYGQLDWRLRNDPRVVVMERTNIRHLTGDPGGGGSVGDRRLLHLAKAGHPGRGQVAAGRRAHHRAGQASV